MIPEFIFTIARVAATKVAAGANAVLANLEMMQIDGGTEVSSGEPIFGSLGILSRPKPPSADGAAEAFTARWGDNAPVLGMRDVRLYKAHGALAEGAFALPGYNGAFVRIDDAGDGTDVVTIYLPHDRDSDGVPQKAHTMSFSKDDVIVAHASGMSVVLVGASEDLVLRSAGGTASAVLNDDAFTVKAPKIVLQGNVIAGRGDPTLAVPISPTTVSTSVFVTP